MNISFEEYTKRLLEIRRNVFELMDDMGIRYHEKPAELERILNIALNGRLDETKEGKVNTSKIITVTDYHKNYITPEYM